ncbi:nicotinamide riboside transporter PnuC [Frondihabitans sp. PAMC 28766]|uniref:nicotinamide riboside transporter PnuC n=1 Tax=Frondihabitans sp. PAMC 28766 TaxID=1795630 RepID=UPI0009EC9A08|nr:nicotinamide riboside transporter PnuC [Frondihabitans sp. PAMC 28766]
MSWLAANWTEMLGFVTGAACVLLAARRNIWNFPIGLANNIVFLWLFVQSALYADAGLQVVYLVLGVAGWVGWVQNRASDDKALIVSTPRRAILPLVVVTVAMGVALVWILSTFTNSTTQLADGSTTAVSLTAQYMLNRRWIENWFVWLAVDIVYVGLYLVKGLWITGLLYLLFIGIAVVGYRAWVVARRHGGGMAAGVAAGADVPPAEAALVIGDPDRTRG